MSKKCWPTQDSIHRLLCSADQAAS